MEEAWAERIMALEKEVAELKEAVRAVQERDGKPIEFKPDEPWIMELSQKITSEMQGISKEMYDEAKRRIQSRSGEGLEITLDTSALIGATDEAIRDNH